MTESLSEAAYRHISHKLVNGTLKAGQKISEKIIAQECNISRTPVREAIRRMTDEGLLYQIPSSGTYVAKPDRRQIIDAFEVRMALECFAIEHAVQKLTKEDRLELRSTCDVMHKMALSLRKKPTAILDGQNLIDFLTADLNFHLIILRATGNQLALKIITNAYQRNQFFGHYSHTRNLRHISWAWRQHSAIERSIRRGDTAKACQLMRAHISWSLDDALASFDRAMTIEARGRRINNDSVEDALAYFTGRFV